jgi:hypothetical protein
MARPLKVTTVSNEVTYDKRHRVGSGLTCQLSWSHPEVMAKMRELFNVRKDEVIVGVEVSDIGITVRMDGSQQ